MISAYLKRCIMDDTNNLPLTEQAYRALKKMIIDLELRPGEILISQQISKQLNISRTPVRDALVRLAQDSLVEPVEGKKFRVTEISLKAINDLYELRKIIESYAIKNAIDKISEDDIREFKRDLSSMEASLNAKNMDNFFRLDYRFHFRIVEICGNSHIIRVISNLHDHIQRIRYFTEDIQGRVEKTLVEHAKIIEALEDRNSLKAEEMLLEHLTHVESDFDGLLKPNGAPYLKHTVIN